MRTQLAASQPQNDNYPIGIGMEGLPATASDVYRLLGDIDPIIAERIVEVGATSDEIGEALARVEDEIGFGEESHVPATSRVNDVISALRDLFDEEEDGYDY